MSWLPLSAASRLRLSNHLRQLCFFDVAAAWTPDPDNDLWEHGVVPVDTSLTFTGGATGLPTFQVRITGTLRMDRHEIDEEENYHSAGCDVDNEGSDLTVMIAEHPTYAAPGAPSFRLPSDVIWGADEVYLRVHALCDERGQRIEGLTICADRNTKAG